VAKFDSVITLRLCSYLSVTRYIHSTAHGYQDAGLKALVATVDHEIGDPTKTEMGNLASLSHNQAVISQVREAARRMLTLKFLTKTFDEPITDLTKLNGSLTTDTAMQHM
jgi:beta-glucosidase-like glycosyl hydrolase